MVEEPKQNDKILMSSISYVMIGLFLLGCGYPRPQMIKGTNEYELHFCQNEAHCFKAAAKTCPNGYEITYYRTRPERFKCK